MHCYIRLYQNVPYKYFEKSDKTEFVYVRIRRALTSTKRLFGSDSLRREIENI
jgi:hypothetical protein